MNTYYVWFVNQYGNKQSHTVVAYNVAQALAWTKEYWGQNIQITSVAKGA